MYLDIMGVFILDLSCGPTYFSLVRLTEISESAQVVILLHWDGGRKVYNIADAPKIHKAAIPWGRRK